MKTSLTVRIASLFALFALTGCGSAADEYVGLWSETGTITYAVNGQTQTQPISGNRRISHGSEREEIILDGSCAIPATVKGGSAVIRNGHSCTEFTNGLAATSTYRTGTLTRSDRSIVLTASGDLLLVGNGKTAAVAFTISETLNRIGD